MSKNTTPLTVLPQSVPAELRSLPQWVCWALEPRRKGETPTKIPYAPDGRRRAKANDPATWGAFEAAIETYHAPRRPPWAGVGFEFAAGGDLVGIDLDDCRAPGNGHIALWASEIIERFATYAEISPSATGVKLWAKGTVPGTGSGKRKSYQSGAVEIYGRGRFFAVTGHKLDGAPATVNQAQEAIDWLFSAVFSSADNHSTLQSTTEWNGEAQSRQRERSEHSGTERTELSLPYPSVDSAYSVGRAAENLESRIEAAIRATQPARVKERRRCLFEFARHVKALPELADAPRSALRPYVRRWHKLALPVIGTKPWEDTWFEFTDALDDVKYPAGAEPITEILKVADAAELPPIALEYDHPALRRLIAFCRELQRAAGDSPFFLDVRTGGRLLEIHHTTVWTWLRGLCRDGVLELVESGSQAKRKANRYRYLPPL